MEEPVKYQHRGFFFFFFFFVTNQEQRGDLEVLDSREVRLHFELGQHDGLIAPECSDMADDYQGIDMALGKQAQGNLRVRGFAPGREMIPPRLLKARYLEHVGNDIAVGDFDSFLKKKKKITRSRSADSMTINGNLYARANQMCHWNNTETRCDGHLLLGPN